MKKKFYILMTFIVFLTSTGFGGCETFFCILVQAFNYLAFRGNTLGTGVVVGANGTILYDWKNEHCWSTYPNVPTTADLNNVVISNVPVIDNLDTFYTTFVVGNAGTVLRSTDNYQTWQNVSIPSLTSNLYGLGLFSFAPYSGALIVAQAVVCGDAGCVWKSTNSGNNLIWTNRSVNTTKKLNSISVVNSGIYVVVGDSGAIYRTLDGGTNWENRSISASVSLKKVVSPNYDRFCTVGTNGAIYTSTDYGYSWALRNSGTTRTLRDVIFSGLDSGIAAGDLGTCRHTTNGGLTWQADAYLNGLTTKNIKCIAKVNYNTVNTITTSSTPGDAVADSTYFLAVSSDPLFGIEPVSNIISEFFSLKQNYPNPFNPVTNIEISIPKTSFVKLVIYDIQGREIETLVNSELKAGGYKIDWDASNYPSGVYFYSISAGEFKETKKMILVK